MRRHGPIAIGLLLLAAGAGLAGGTGGAVAAGARTQLVFASSGHLWAVSPQGRGLHPFARIPENTNDISASESGRRVAIISHAPLRYPRQGSIRTIYLWRYGHPGLRRLLRIHTVADSSVAISPDGRLIAYGRENEIWMMRADGSHRQRVTQGSRRAFDPAFSPSGKNLFFVRQSMNAGTNRIYRKPFTTPYHSEVGLTPPGADDHSPVVSSRHTVAFIQLGEGRRGAVTPDRLRVMDPDGHNPRTVTRSNDPRFNLYPDFSPSGRSISYVRLREVNGDRSPRRYSLRTIRTSGKNPRVAVGHLRARPRGLQWTLVPGPPGPGRG
ncbi:MAG: hypothetical protein U0R52_11250 [Solirubrobacterales bacterium]